ncbi:MAG: phage tail tube protein [Hydrogenoanaerobacterium sp.]
MDNLQEIKFTSENAISKSEGKAYITISGQNYVLFYIKKLSAKIKKKKIDIRVAGQRGTGHKATSWSGEGELEIFNITSAYKEIFLDYIHKGIDCYFSIMLTNEDVSTKYGKETKVLTGCNFDEVAIAEFEGDDGVLESSLPFTFEGVELLSKFNA